MSVLLPTVPAPFVVAATKIDSSFQPLRPRALREMVFEILLQAIVSGEMKTGDWLNHQQLAKRFDVSSTPVREALQQLALFGIVENQHNRGTVIRPFGPTQIEEIYYVRALLEAAATRLACAQIDPAQLNVIKTKTAELLAHETANWAIEVPKIDKDLHDLIGRSCGKQRLQEEIHRYHVFIFVPKPFHLDAHRIVLAEHLEIIEHLEKHQPEKAAQAMLDHIHHGAKMCQGLLFGDRRENAFEV